MSNLDGPGRIGSEVYFPDQPWADDEFWAAFDDPDDYEASRPLPWYRRIAGLFVALFAFGLLATSALLPWGEVIDSIGNIRETDEILQFSEDFAEDSPWGWLVEDVRVRPILEPSIGGFVTNNPPDGIIVIDQRSWDPDDLRALMAHEMGHLLDFAVWGAEAERRGGLESEAWAECASVSSGFERPHSAPRGSPYHCTNDELAVYEQVVDDLGPVCKRWGDRECRVVEIVPAVLGEGG